MPRSCSARQKVILDVTADSGISSVSGHRLESNGGGPSTPLRQNQNWEGFEKKVLLMAFEVEPIRDWTIDEAYLHIALPREGLYGVGLCTVLSPWNEGDGQNFGHVAGASSWSYRSTPAQGEDPTAESYWAGPGSDLATVAWANPAARYSHAGPGALERSEAAEGRTVHLRIPVDPAVLHAVANGTAYGLVMTDDKGQVSEAFALKGDGLPYRYNEAEDTWVYTREIGDENLRPRFEVYGRPAPKAVPGAIMDMKVSSVDPPTKTALITFTAPAGDGGKRDLFAYEVVAHNTRVTEANWEKATPLPRWSIVKPMEAGQEQRLPIFTLEPGAYHIGVRGVDEAGHRGPIASVNVDLPRAKPVSLRPLRAAKPGDRRRTLPAFGGALTVSVVPDLAKVDPVGGLLLSEGDSYSRGEAYLANNDIWSAGDRQVTLHAAANEVVAFKVVLGLPARSKQLSNVRVTLDDLTSKKGGEIPADPNVRTFRVWYVKSEDETSPMVGPNQEMIEDRTVRPSGWHGEICLPLADPYPKGVQVPATDNGVPGQRYQTVWMDLFVPRDTAAGEYAGTLSISADRLPRSVELNVRLTVLPIVLSDEINWTVELNRYNSPLRWMDIDPDEEPERGRKILHDFYRMAQEHRLTLVALPYTHSGNVRDGREYLPETTGEGTDRRIADWAGFDRWIGPLLDGSAFSAQQGYVGPRAGKPITHMFLPFHEAWPMPVDRDTYADWADVRDREALAQWAKTSRRPHEAFTEAYKKGYQEVVKQYFQHLNDKGYTRSQHLFFFNNKYYFKVSFFGDMGRRGVSFWLLDEPVDYDDYDTNRFLFDLSKKGALSAGGRARARFRADISQPEMNRGLWDNLVDLWMLGGRSRFAATGAIRRIMMPTEEYWSYGGGSAVSAPLVNNVTHSLYLWCLGDTGYMPWWNCFGGRGSKAWRTGDTLAIYYRGQDYPGGGDIYSGPLPSVRMKAVRRAQQDIEYLHLLAESKGWTRARVRLGLRDYADDPEATHLGFDDLTLDRAGQLRRAVVHAILMA